LLASVVAAAANAGWQRERREKRKAESARGKGRNRDRDRVEEGVKAHTVGRVRVGSGRRREEDRPPGRRDGGRIGRGRRVAGDGG